MLTLISPAKKIDENRELALAPSTTPEFLENAEYLAAKMATKSSKQIKTMMKLSDDLAELNHERFQRWVPEPEQPFSFAALSGFNGEVYRGLDAPSLNEADLEFAQEHLGILSGLYGLLRPLDRIMAYRLEMGCPFKVTPSKSNLYKYWGDVIREQVDNRADGLVLNLASNEYFKAVTPKNLKSRIITCEFKENKNGEYKALMTYAKLARGMMARYVIKNRLDGEEGLRDFSEDGYLFNDSLSEGDTLVFTRG